MYSYENTVTLTGSIRSIKIIQPKDCAPTAKVVICSGSEWHTLFFCDELTPVFLEQQRRIGDPMLIVGTDIKVRGKLAYYDDEGRRFLNHASNAVCVLDLINTGPVQYVTREERARLDRLSVEADR